MIRRHTNAKIQTVFDNSKFQLYFSQRTESHLDHYIKYINFKTAKIHRHQSLSECKSEREIKDRFVSKIKH